MASLWPSRCSSQGRPRYRLLSGAGNTYDTSASGLRNSWANRHETSGIEIPTPAVGTWIFPDQNGCSTLMLNDMHMKHMNRSRAIYGWVGTSGQHCLEPMRRSQGVCWFSSIDSHGLLTKLWRAQTGTVQIFLDIRPSSSMYANSNAKSEIADPGVCARAFKPADVDHDLLLLADAESACQKIEPNYPLQVND